MSTYDIEDISPARGGDEDEVMRDLVRMVVDQIWWVIGIAALVLGAAIFYAQTATRIYSADAMLQIDPSQQGSATAAAIGSLSSAGSGMIHTDAEIEIIKSRSVVEPVVEQFRLNFGAGPKMLPYLSRISQLFARPGHPMPAWFGMRSYAWGGEQFAVDSITVPKALEGVQLTLRARGESRFDLLDPAGRLLLSGKAGTQAEGNGVTIKVTQLVARPDTEFFITRANQLDAVMGLVGGLQVMERGHDTGIVQLSFMGTDPKAITAITNAVAQSYLAQRTTRAQEEASKMLDFLNSELPRLRQDLQRAEHALSEYQARAGTFQPTAEASVYLQGGLDYEKQIAALRIARAQLLTRFTIDSPEVQQTDAQIAALSAERARFEDHFKDLPGSEREAVSLQRDAKVANDIYVALLNRTQELSIQKAGTVGNVHIIDEALVPTVPVAPKAGLIISAGALLGVLAGIAFAFCRHMFITGISDPETIERRFSLPIFGSIPLSAEQTRSDLKIANSKQAALPAPERNGVMRAVPSGVARLIRPRAARPSERGHMAQSDMVPVPAPHAPTRALLAKTHPFDVSVEGLRGLRATLQFGLVDTPNRIIAFTSPTPADGKSFLCANLAALFAESGKRVLLIDADLRRGRLAQYFGRSPQGGLTELLTGQVDFDIAARATGVSGLHFIASGAYPPNPSEILTSSRFTEMLRRFSEEFDLVIIDTPPLLAVADSSIVANIAGATVLVIRAGAHTEREIGASLKKLQRARARVIGGVLNAVELKRGARYGHYDYAYAYTYTTDMSGSDYPKP
ncbi:polysaccharide biosynthesis tyrosine autokinase [Paraburkholderia unamae]|uniref:Tyrosine-protein kinase Etk/Wzc n=1 Tax=Paraburkholderia unamae TaxID=219649 RepID=A0ABX5KK59_9BURK|nr:polysaccharide biosynthesis tyrosine autokinase [Paraburkholderia unamae]PVX82250.1 tyrosine-protein kinase Etk/Wzc [Paraburkholderia unamae]CAG9272220.1 Tyrosine-protein kinase Wzc [Paraburkholderia unamae]